MAPTTNLVQTQLHYASGQFTRFIDLVITYKWFIAVGAVLFIALIWWLWRR